MRDQNCLFCKIIAGEIPCQKLYEDEQTFAFLDIGPVSRGHTLVIPKNHAENMTEGSVEDAQAVIATVHHLAPKICAALGATAYNLGMNHGVDAGQDVFHTHMHLMPRYAGEARTFVKTHPSAEELAEVGGMIREILG